MDVIMLLAPLPEMLVRVAMRGGLGVDTVEPAGKVIWWMSGLSHRKVKDLITWQVKVTSSLSQTNCLPSSITVEFNTMSPATEIKPIVKSADTPHSRFMPSPPIKLGMNRHRYSNYHVYILLASPLYMFMWHESNKSVLLIQDCTMRCKYNECSEEPTP